MKWRKYYIVLINWEKKLKMNSRKVNGSLENRCIVFDRLEKREKNKMTKAWRNLDYRGELNLEFSF